MAYTNINISYNEGTLCEEVSFSEPGEHAYTPGASLTISDSRLWRNRSIIIQNVNYSEDGQGGLVTTVSGLSAEYGYTRKAPNFDISFFTMTFEEIDDYLRENPNPDSKVFMQFGDKYGVGGWSMHSIVEKIVIEWMGLSAVENTLPDFWIGDFSINIGSTFFEAMASLVSEFDPIIVLSGRTLYILERSGAGMLSGGLLELEGSSSRSVDREYIPIPGCIKVEGLEGMYIESKDPSPPETISIVSRGERHEVALEDFSYNANTLEHMQGPYGSIAVAMGTHSFGVEDSAVQSSYTMEYDWNGRPKKRVETTTSPEMGMAIEQTVTLYSHFSNGDLASQLTQKSEVFVYDSSDGSYTKYDTRDHYYAGLETTQTLTLIMNSYTIAVYTLVLNKVYVVDTLTANKQWNTEEEMWVWSYEVNHDLVEAGESQHIGDESFKTLQVYAGTCPLFQTEFSVLNEPPKLFSIPTPDWESIEDCYNYLSALVAYQFQKVSATTPIIDPLPLMAISGLGSILEAGIKGRNYVRGYNISIDAQNGNTVELTMEARRA